MKWKSKRKTKTQLISNKLSLSVTSWAVRRFSTPNLCLNGITRNITLRENTSAARVTKALTFYSIWKSMSIYTLVRNPISAESVAKDSGNEESYRSIAGTLITVNTKMIKTADKRTLKLLLLVKQSQQIILLFPKI